MQERRVTAVKSPFAMRVTSPDPTVEVDDHRRGQRLISA